MNLVAGDPRSVSQHGGVTILAPPRTRCGKEKPKFYDE